MAFDRRDDFWDIDKLVPNAKKPHPRFRTERQTKGVEIEGDGVSGESKLTLSLRGGESEESTYVPLSNPLIRKVTVRRFKGGYDFYESFRKAALLYYDVVAEPSPFVSFYSYMPQYSQMSREQKNYYFYLRSEIRRGNYSLKTDVSYLYLYVYEILNLPEKIPAKEGIVLLCELWRRYRKQIPAIDRYFSVWVQDYCIVHRLDAPTALIEDFIYDIIDAASFKEFYLGGVYSKNACEITALLSCLSDYDWRTGRYAGGAERDMYKKHIEGAMLPVLRSLWEKGALFLEDSAVERLSRDAFPCSLCTHSVKCRIEIEYYPLGRSDGLRDRVTSALKYVENCLRAALSVKSRLAVKHLHEEDKLLIDAYFAEAFRIANQKRREAQRAAYESLYDAPRQEMSFAGAESIEKNSWQNTWLLVDTEEIETVKIEQPSIALENETPAESTKDAKIMIESASSSPKAETDEPQRAFLRAALVGDKEAMRRVAADAFLPAETLAERINELFLEKIGDVVFEIADGGISLIEDYREEALEWLQAQT